MSDGMLEPNWRKRALRAESDAAAWKKRASEAEAAKLAEIRAAFEMDRVRCQRITALESAARALVEALALAKEHTPVAVEWTARWAAVAVAQKDVTALLAGAAPPPQTSAAIGTYACPVLGCEERTPHAHAESVQAELHSDRLFLAADGPLSERQIAAAKILRREIRNVRGVGPRGSSLERAAATAAWGRLQMARQVLDTELRRALADVDASAAPPPAGFLVRTTCCGRDNGTHEFATWKEADDFREGYLSGPGVAPDSPGGHERSAIIESAAPPPQTEAPRSSTDGWPIPDTAIEHVAEAIYRARYEEAYRLSEMPFEDWDSLAEHERDDYRSEAKAALRAFELSRGGGKDGGM